MTKRMLKKRLLSRRRKGRPHIRRLDNVMIGVTGWRGRVEDRASWRKSTKGCSASAAAVIMIMMLMTRRRRFDVLTVVDSCPNRCNTVLH